MEYRYNDDASVRVRMAPPNKERVLEAKILLPTTPATDKAPLDQYLRDKGFSVTYDVIENQPALVVGGFPNYDSLLKTLAEGGYAKGSVTQATSPEDTPQKLSTWQKIRKGSLRLSAVFYELGNAFSFMSGVFSGNKAQMINGLAFSVGDTIMLAFGHQNYGHKYDNMIRGMNDLMTKENMAVPNGSPLAVSVQEQLSGAEKANRFMRKNVVVFKSLSEITAGAALIKAGIGLNLPDKKRAVALLITGFGGGMLIHEKKPAEFRAEKEENPNAPPPGFFGKIKDAIQRKPLIFSGTLAFLNNIFVLRSGLEGKKKKGRTFSQAFHGKLVRPENAWIMDLATSGSFMVANTLYAMSSKNVGGRAGDSLDNKMYTVAANMVLAQPEANQETALTKLGEFLSKQQDIDATAREAAQHIRQKAVQLAAVHPMAPKIAVALNHQPATLITPSPREHPVIGRHTEQIAKNKGEPEAAQAL